MEGRKVAIYSVLIRFQDVSHFRIGKYTKCTITENNCHYSCDLPHKHSRNIVNIGYTAKNSWKNFTVLLKTTDAFSPVNLSTFRVPLCYGTGQKRMFSGITSQNGTIVYYSLHADDSCLRLWSDICSYSATYLFSPSYTLSRYKW